MRILYFLAIAILSACSTGGPVEVGGITVEGGLRAWADQHNFDYTGYLDKALNGDAASFSEVLRLDLGKDSTAELGHGLVLRSLLNRLGDEVFSQKIAQLPDDAKSRIWSVLELAGVTSLKNDSPMTFKALVPMQTPVDLNGLYVFDDKKSSFIDCAAFDKRYLVVDETAGQLEHHYRRLLKFPYPGQPIVVQLKGFFTPYYGSLELTGDFSGFLVVSEVVKTETKNFRNTCIPYDFWAVGTEPFWAAQVSAAEGVIEYRGMDDEGTKVFPYQAPTNGKGVSVYTGVNQDSGDNIRIEVDSLPCGDGMSDQTYRLSVKLTINGKDVNGCGIPFQPMRDSLSANSGN